MHSKHFRAWQESIVDVIEYLSNSKENAGSGCQASGDAKTNRCESTSVIIFVVVDTRVKRIYIASHALFASLWSDWTTALVRCSAPPPVCHMKVEAHLVQGQNKQACRLFLRAVTFVLSAKLGSCEYHFLKNLWHDSTRELNGCQPTAKQSLKPSFHHAAF